MVTFEKFDVYFAVFTSVKYSVVSMQGYLRDIPRISRHLKYHMQRQVLCWIEGPDFSKVRVARQNWYKLHPDDRNGSIPIMPALEGKPIRISNYWDTKCAHDLEAKKSVTELTNCIDKIGIYWYSRWQVTVKISNQEAKMTAAKCWLKMQIRWSLLRDLMCILQFLHQ